MQKLFALAVVLTIAASVACGKSDAERQAEEAAANAAKAAEAATKAATDKAAAATKQAGDDVARGMSEVAKALSGLTPTGADGKPVQVRTAESLTGALPQMPGWEMAKPKNQQLTAPFPISQTDATYKKGDGKIDVTVVDAAQAQMMLMPWSMMMAAGYSKETSAGYEKAVTVNGHPGFERWRKSGNRGELNVLVNQRFMVTIEGRDLADTKVLHEFAAKLNAGALK